MPFVFESTQKAVTRPDRKVAVLGGGSWATAIVKILSGNLKRVYWWVREPEIREGVKAFGHNPLYLNEAELHHQHISISNNLKQTVKKADVIVIVIPSAYVYNTLSTLPTHAFDGKQVISATKGLLPESMETVTDYVRNTFCLPAEQLGIIVGPSHAEEIARERLTYLTSASANPQLAADVANLFRNRYVITHVSDDMAGIEFSVVLKNIYALAAGIFRGLGAGDNLMAVFNTNCVREMLSIITAVSDNKERNVATSPYLGDFLVTTYSQYSRNRNFGFMIGKGYSVQTVQMEMKMVAEGHTATYCMHHLNQNKFHLELPILTATYRILYEKAVVKTTIKRLLEYLK